MGRLLSLRLCGKTLSFFCRRLTIPRRKIKVLGDPACELSKCCLDVFRHCHGKVFCRLKHSKVIRDMKKSTGRFRRPRVALLIESSRAYGRGLLLGVARYVR